MDPKAFMQGVKAAGGTGIQDYYPSMAQDMVSGRKSELELFSGTVVPIARKLSIDAPVLTSLLEKITAMEQEL